MTAEEPEDLIESDVPARTTPATLPGAIRTAVGDAYYHSWRLLPANIVWAATAFALLVALLAGPLLVVLTPLLAVPTAGIFRITTRIVRGGPVSFWDALGAWRHDLGTTLLAGFGLVGAALVFASNILTGLAGDSPLGWALATFAAWGIVGLWLFAWTLWPVLLDPERADRGVVDRARLAALLVLAHPVRIGVLGIVLAVFLAVSAVAIVALVTISVSLAALVASRFVLTAADRLEADLGRRAPAATATTRGGDSAAEPSAR